jgi:hypothetical protein
MMSAFLSVRASDAIGFCVLQQLTREVEVLDVVNSGTTRHAIAPENYSFSLAPWRAFLYTGEL